LLNVYGDQMNSGKNFIATSISDRFLNVFNLFQKCEELIFKLVGRELEDLAVLDTKPWVMHAEVAQKFLSFNNRVILAGDAAHRFPPAGGFGKCSSLNQYLALASTFL